MGELGWRERERGMWPVVVVKEGRREREGWVGNFLFLKVGPTSSKFILIRF